MGEIKKQVDEKKALRCLRDKARRTPAPDKLCPAAPQTEASRLTPDSCPLGVAAPPDAGAVNCRAQGRGGGQGGRGQGKGQGAGGRPQPKGS